MKCSALTAKIDQSAPGVWQSRRFFKEEVFSAYRLSLGEGKTSLERIVIADKKIWLKREDTNPHGSHKDRSLAYQVAHAAANGCLELVISSSGNAAIAAAAFCQAAKIKLWVFLSPDINRGKFLQIQSYHPQIIVSHRAIRLANYFAARQKLNNLRPSTDDNSIEGFKSLGLELFEQWSQPRPIFTYVTSGSSLLGIHAALVDLAKLKCLDKIPPLNEVSSGPVSLAGRGGTSRTRRRAAIDRAVRATGGQKYVMTEDEIATADKQLASQHIKTSPEGQAAVAAALKSGYPEVTCILSGRYYPDERLQPGDLTDVKRAETFADLDKIIKP